MIYECFLKRHKTRLFLLTTGSTKRKENRLKKKKKTRFSLKIEKKEKSLVPELSGKKPRLRVLEERKSEERERVYLSLQDCFKRCRNLAQHIVNKMQSNVEKIKREKY